jgi:hypothetical protein
MCIEAKEAATKLAVRYCRIQPNEDLISLAEKMYNFFKATDEILTINTTKFKVLCYAIDYCEIQPNEDLFEKAKEIYQFVTKEEK